MNTQFDPAGYTQVPMTFLRLCLLIPQVRNGRFLPWRTLSTFVTIVAIVSLKPIFILITYFYIILRKVCVDYWRVKSLNRSTYVVTGDKGDNGDKSPWRGSIAESKSLWSAAYVRDINDMVEGSVIGTGLCAKENS